MRSIILLAAVLAGCSTTNVPTDQASVVPPSRVYMATSASAPGAVPLVVKRDSGMLAMACNVRLFVNGSPAADLATGEAVRLYLTPGSYMLGAEARGICIGGLTESRHMHEAGKINAYRISYQASGSLVLQPTAF